MPGAGWLGLWGGGPLPELAVHLLARVPLLDSAQSRFASTIRMDMAFFDAPENQTASILVSLERHMILGCSCVMTPPGPSSRSHHFTGGRR